MGDTKKFAREAKKQGLKDQAAGTVKEGVSKATGNKSGEMEGKAQRKLGKAKEQVGEVANDAANKARKRA